MRLHERRSALDNDEINAVILGREFAKQMLSVYEADLKASQAIDLHTWERRPLIIRFREMTSRIWGRLL